MVYSVVDTFLWWHTKRRSGRVEDRFCCQQIDGTRYQRGPHGNQREIGRKNQEEKLSWFLLSSKKTAVAIRSQKRKSLKRKRSPWWKSLRNPRDIYMWHFTEHLIRDKWFTTYSENQISLFSFNLMHANTWINHLQIKKIYTMRQRILYNAQIVYYKEIS